VVTPGTSFQDFFVTDSLCCPSRSSLLRGQYVHNHHIIDNVPPNGGYAKFYSEGLEASTVAVWLHQAGYRTSLFGKYLNGFPGTIVKPLYKPPGWDDWYAPI